MSGFFDELGKKLAERWLTLLVFPGLIYLVCLTIALVLQHDNALCPETLLKEMDRLTAQPAAANARVLLLAVVAILAAAGAAGLAAGALGWLLERAWNSKGRHRPARWLTAHRQRRWDNAQTRVRRQTTLAARARPASGESPPDVAAAIAARQSIGLLRPQRPTWIADRLHAADQRLYQAYDLDLTSAWPRLWLIIPDTARTELTTAHNAYSTAARLAGWAILYLPLAWWWWPALPITAVLTMTAWIRARTAIAVLADLVEATVDLFSRDLAIQLGILTDGPMTRHAGLAVTVTLRKDPETNYPTT
ncbi:hypothetical protein AB0G15_42375 [Streptosporangium sp. NPDC023825]|uniref:hypothetical protein n=1 Tax=Streptosporangium sp. NPDC023825 TaxID=3154909 RepID=UPI003423BD12